MQVQLTTGVPVVYGVLNCLTTEQASVRVGPDSPLPHCLAVSTIQMAALRSQFLPLHSKDTSVAACDILLSPPLVPPCTQS